MALKYTKIREETEDLLDIYHGTAHCNTYIVRVTNPRASMKTHPRTNWLIDLYIHLSLVASDTLYFVSPRSKWHCGYFHIFRHMIYGALLVPREKCSHPLYSTSHRLLDIVYNQNILYGEIGDYFVSAGRIPSGVTFRIRGVWTLFFIPLYEYITLLRLYQLVDRFMNPIKLRYLREQ